MTASSYSSSRNRNESYEAYRSPEPAARTRAVAEHARGVSAARERIAKGDTSHLEGMRDAAAVADPRLAANAITRPSKKAKRVVVVLVDNSGSNEAIAEHLKRATGYFTAFLGAIDPDAQAAWIFFSDHVDGDRMLQYVDFTSPDENGDKRLYSSMERISGANGGDYPEAIECAVTKAAGIDFGHVAIEDRSLVIVTDAVPHGMPDWSRTFPGSADHGCPKQVDPFVAMREARTAFGSIEIIGSGSDPAMGKLQKQLFRVNGEVDQEEIAANFFDLSDIPSAAHRNGLVGAAVLFTMARRAGGQTVQMFLSRLYRKWLENPIFGDRSDAMARKRIRSFGTYLLRSMTQQQIDKMMADIIPD